MLSRALIPIICVVFAGSCVLAPTQLCAGPPESIEVVLAKPVSPGTLALLIPYIKDPRAPTRWAQALSNSDPQVRATAARLLYMSWAPGALPLLRRAMTMESVPAVAREIARPLLAFGGAADDHLVLEAARRIPDNELAVILAQVRKEATIDEIADLMALKMPALAPRQIAWSVVEKDPGRLDRLVRMTLDASDAIWWESLLNLARTEGIPIDLARLEAALRSKSAEIRDCTWWFIAILAADGKPLPNLLLQPREADGEMPPASVEAHFGRELAARALKAAPIEQPAFEALARTGAELAMPSYAWDALKGPLSHILSPSERDALGIQEAPPPVNATPDSAGPAPPIEYAAIHTIGSIPDGFAADVFKQTGCKNPDSQDIAGAVVRFSGNKLQELRWIATTLPRECEAAARYITVASLLPESSQTQGQLELIALPMHRTFLTCLSRTDVQIPDHAAVRVGRKNVKPPRKIRNTRPVYPPSAINARRQGIVIIESTIAPAGCIAQAKVLRSMGTDLDIAALRAVTDWAFTPTLLDGAAVPVIMTVTVQFTLR